MRALASVVASVSKRARRARLLSKNKKKLSTLQNQFAPTAVSVVQ